jgi:NADPH-dependent 2,4-dienoyl-CoA reductase/sulfur reductase-like enzyme
MQQQWDVLVIGAGPAGLNAASAAAENGLEVLLIDEQELPGGQIYRSVSAGNSQEHFLQAEDRQDGLRIIKRFNASGANYRPKTTVWFAEPGRVICHENGRSREIKNQILMVATGAMERPVPFKGWSLPGVMGAGAADILFKSAGVAPQGPVVLAGNGPLIPLVGSHLLTLGVEIAALLDTGPFINKLASLRHIPSAMKDMPFMWKGAKMLKALIAGKVPIVRGVRDITAVGHNRVEQARYRASGKQQQVEAEMLLFHEGVIPRTHVSRMLKLDHAWDRVQRYWYPVCNKNGLSSQRGIYVVGDGAFVHGAGASALKGELAGIDAAAQLKVLSEAEVAEKSFYAKARLRKALAPRSFVDAYFAPDTDLYKVDDEVMVCRCEGVSAKDIRLAVAEGCHDVNEIKIRTRCGMGPCQGRMCGPAAAEIAAAALGTAPSAVGALNIRPPVRPISFREICEFEHED